MGKEIVPYEKPSTRREQLSPPRSFTRTERPTDRPTGEDERRGNSGERIADRLSQEISEVETSYGVSPSFSFVVADTCLFLSIVLKLR